jgi:hypothetical protein
MIQRCPGCHGTNLIAGFAIVNDESRSECQDCGLVSPPEEVEPYWCLNNPNVPRVWSSSSLATIAECPRKFELRYVEGWTAREENLDFAFGSAFHSVMEMYWRLRWNKESHQDSLDTAYQLAHKLGNTLPPPVRPKQAGKTRFGLQRTLVWYFEQHDDPLESIVAVGDNQPGIELHFNILLDLVSPDGEPYQIQGYLDSIRHFQDLYTVWDYKTTAGSISDFYAQRFEIDIQNHIYTIAARVLTDHKFTCFMADIASTALTYSDFHRVPIMLTPNELDEALLDFTAWIRAAERYAEQEYYPKNTKACTFCEFNGICNKDPVLRFNFLKSDFSEKRRDIVEIRK